MAFGLTDQGFVIKRLADIKSEIEDSLRSSLGNQINVLPESVFGQIIGVVADRESLLWELAEDVYNSQYPDTAFGVSLDNVAALSGITRQGAQPSTLSGYRLFGTATTIIPAGTQFSVDGNPTAIFETLTEVTLVAGQNAIDQITFDLLPDAGTWRLNFRGSDTPDFDFDDDAATIQAALNALPFGSGIVVTGDYSTGFDIEYDGDAGLQEQDTISIDDNQLTSSATPVVIQAAQSQNGVNQGVVDLQATENGATLAPAGTLTVIVNPVSGLDRGINVIDATAGRLVETDNELRARRATTLQVAGAGTPEAIRSRLLDLTGVTNAFVFENQTLVTDPDGRPAKSFEAVVQGGDDQEVIDLLWLIKPAGIQTFGSVSGTATDSQGQPQPIAFSRPTDVDIYLEVDLTVDPNEFPANGLAAAETALVNQGNSFGIGNDVIVTPKLICALDDIPGILGVTVRIGTNPSPTLGNNIAIDVDEVAIFDSARTTVIQL